MALPRPNKGAAPATGKVKPTRAELLMTATQALAVEQLPDAHTMTAIEGERAGEMGAQPQSTPSAPLSNDGQGSAATAAVPAASVQAASPLDATAPGTTTIELRAVDVDAVRPSPFQPKGRPSTAAVDAVRQAIADAGSLDALVSPDGAPRFARLGPEAARLAELAYDVAEHGMKVPVEIRTLDDGALECLSGHRRLAAARIAGLAAVPAIERGAMSNAAAAATVLRGNLHRENFTTWQEAALVAEVQERRRADGFRDNVRTLGAVMGWSHGKVNMLLRIRRALAPDLLARIGQGDPAPVEELLARAPYRDLERLTSEPDDDRRVAAARRLLGLGDAPATARRDRDRCVHRPKRGGGFVIEVHEPVESLDAGDAALLRTYLETQLTRVHARLGALGHH